MGKAKKKREKVFKKFKSRKDQKACKRKLIHGEKNGKKKKELNENV